MGMLSAFVHFIIHPLHLMLGLILALFCAAMVHNKTRRRRWVLITGSLALVWSGNLVFPIVPYYMVQMLENRFTPGPADNLDTIIILGGWQGNSLTFTERGQPVYGPAADRLLYGLALARQNPDADVIFTGGLKVFAAGASEAEITKATLAQLGLAENRFRIEGASTNTAENAAFTAVMLQADNARIGLVTSAAHMPRAMAVYRAEGIEPVPLPTDYLTLPGNPPLRFLYRSGFALTHTALREWVGLVAYRLLGRSETFFPAP